MSKEEKNDDVRRLQFDFKSSAMSRLNHLKEKMGASSYAEVVRRSLHLMSVVLESQESGAKVIIETPDGNPDRQIIVL